VQVLAHAQESAKEDCKIACADEIVFNKKITSLRFLDQSFDFAR